MKRQFMKYENFNFFVPDGMANGLLKNRLFQDFCITKTGLYERAAEHQCGRSVFNEYQIVYCHQGGGRLVTGDREYPISDGQIFFCMKNHGHFYVSDPVNPWTIYWAHFNGEYAPELLRKLKVDIHRPVIPAADPIFLIARFMDIFTAMGNGYNPENILFASGCLRLIFNRLINSSAVSAVKNRNVRMVQRMVDWMKRNLEKDVSVEEFLHSSGLPKSTFFKIFKETVGLSPVQYLIQLKMQKACELLTTTRRKVKEVSAAVGYADEYYFSRLFKKTTGSSPSAYRGTVLGKTDQLLLK